MSVDIVQLTSEIEGWLRADWRGDFDRTHAVMSDTHAALLELSELRKLRDRVDGIRDELRSAIFFTLFQVGMCEIEQRTVAEHWIRQCATQFVNFGINTELLSDEEAAEWTDCTTGRRDDSGVVWMKYNPDAIGCD